MSTRRAVASAAGMIMVAILVSRIMGFFRETIAGKLFDRMATDAFFAAFVAPDLMYYFLVGGALSAAFIPVFTQYLAAGDEREAWKVASSFLNIAVILLVIVTAMGVLFAPALAPLVAYKFTGEKARLLVYLIRIMFPAVFFTALAGLSMGVLNSYQHFFAPAYGPVIYNIVIIIGAYVLGREMGVTGLALGVVGGAASNFLLQLLFVARMRVPYVFSIDLRNPGLRRIGTLMLPALVGLSVTQVNLVVNQNLASGLAEGSITALRFANRLMQLPLGLFALAISTAVFPTMTRQVARGELDQFKNTVSLATRMVFFITLPAAAGLIALRVPIVRLLFEGGEFTRADTLSTAYALLFYSLGLFAHSGVQIVTRAYYSLQDTRTPVKVGLLTVAANILMNLALLKYTNLAHGGLALAFSLTGIMNLLVLLAILRVKMGGIDGRRITLSFVQALVASLAVAVASRITSNIIEAAPGFMKATSFLRFPVGSLVQVSLAIIVGTAAFVGVATGFRMEEARVVWDMIKGRLSLRRTVQTE